MKFILQAALLMLLSVTAAAQIDQQKSVDTSQVVGDYRVHFSVFNSAFVPADIAQLHQLIRAKDRALVNISVTREGQVEQGVGIKAVVEGSATNLMQQRKSLAFKEINEGIAHYYLAPLRHSQEELINFEINLLPEGEVKPIVIKFNRTLYIDK